jgi:cytoskeletal protein RodZ
MGQANQGGSVVGFVIGAVVLAALVVGGAYWVNWQSRQTATPPKQDPPKTQPQAPKPEQPKKEEKSTPSQTPPTSTSPAQLPATGSEQAIGASLALGLVTMLIVYYARSRHSRFSL